MYDGDVISPVEFEVGVITDTDEGLVMNPICIMTEDAAGKYKGNWRVLTTSYSLSNKDTYIYFKVKNTTTYYVDNIRLE